MTDLHRREYSLRFRTMATRSLTEVFILMRNNAMQNRHIFSEHVSKLAPVRIGTTPESPYAVSLHAPTWRVSICPACCYFTYLDIFTFYFNVVGLVCTLLLMSSVATLT